MARMVKLRAARVWATSVLLATAAVFPAGIHADFTTFRAPTRILSLFSLPGETVLLDLATYVGVAPSYAGRFEVESAGGLLVLSERPGTFRLHPPDEIGIHAVTFREPLRPGVPPSAYRVQVVVMRPAGDLAGGHLNGYPVGIYPSEREGTESNYERPSGFVEITQENRATLLSDHVALADLDCKLDVPFPHYAVVRTSLLVKLESLIQVLNLEGLPGDDLRVMSGYRTPQYNRSIGNPTTFSRHLVGDAADVYVDGDGDERMDDLDGDGTSDYRDALTLYRFVDAMDEQPTFESLVGGASAYRPQADHGPFVHLDTRGYPARW